MIKAKQTLPTLFPGEDISDYEEWACMILMNSINLEGEEQLLGF